MSATMVAVDLGAQSGRVALGRFDGERLEVHEVHRFPNVPVRAGGRLQWDVLRLYADTVDGLRAAAAQWGQVDSVGVDGWAIDFGLVDRMGRLVQNPVHYRDARRAAAFGQALEHVPARELYERTGIQLLPINTVFELAGMVAEDDPALEIAEALLLVPDLLHFWLCGARVAEYTNATTTQCLEARTASWASDLLHRLGIPARLLPPVVPSGSSLGSLTRDVAADTGLHAAQVVAPATHDTASAVAAVPFRRDGSAYVSAGTWSLVGVETREAVLNDATFAANVTNEGGVEGTFRLLRNVAGLWLLDECRRAWAAAGVESDFPHLLSLAREAPALHSLVDPDDPLFATPGDMPARVREFCSRTGQVEPETVGAITRCVLESLALAHAHALELVVEAVGAAPSEVHMVGGGSRNEALCRWTASASGLPVLAGPAEATEIGNLAVQAIALGELGSLAEAREVVGASFVPVEYEPEPDAVWFEARERFSELAASRPLAEVAE